jgi:hypothetical protein
MTALTDTVPAANPASPPPPAPQGTTYAPRIVANRRQIDDRFPSLGFTVDTGGRRFFEVLLATDATLFDSANVSRRNDTNFYSSSRQHGLIPAADSVHPYLVPVAVLRGFAQAVPRPREIFYAAVAYQGADGSNPDFSLAPQLLPSAAPSVSIAKDFTGTTLATVLAVSVDKLRRVGATLDDPVPPSDREDTAEGEDGYGAPALSLTYTLPEPAHSAPPASNVGVQSNHDPLPDYQLALLPGQRDTGGGPQPKRVRDPLLPGQTDSPTSNGHKHQVGHAMDFALGADYDPDQQEPDYLADDEDDTDYTVAGTAALSDSYHGMDDVDRHPRTYQSLDDPAATPAPATTGQPPTAVTSRALVPDDKMRILERVGALESGNDYSAINADGEYEGRFGTDHPAYHHYHVGLSYGFIQFTQDSGKLGQLLRLMQSRDQDAFSEAFGPDASQLIAVTTSPGPPSRKSPEGRSPRVQPVAGADIWQEPWVSRFRAAGRNTSFQAAQRELAATGYLDPMLEFAGWLGLDTERALTLVADRSVQMGVGGAKRWIVSTVGPINAPAVRQQALTSLGFADLHSFQVSVPHLHADGDWGPNTHAAMVAALRRLGAASPVPIPTTEQMVDALLRQAATEPWHARVEALRIADISDARYGL